MPQPLKHRLELRPRFRRHADAEIGDLPFRKQPGVAALDFRREEDIGRPVRVEQRHGYLPGLDQPRLRQARRGADLRPRPVGADHELRFYGEIAPPDRIEPAFGPGVARLLHEQGVEAAAVDHRAGETVGAVEVRRLDEGAHGLDGLNGDRRHPLDILADQPRHELGALDRFAGRAFAVHRQHRCAGARRLPRRRSPGRAEADDKDIDAFAHAPHPAGTATVSPPTLIEQQACCCSIGRPMASATATAPSAGKAMPSSPAMTA